ncbi:hypothetical protein AAVH_10724 [Aphelenchoides avenae]|nr:hypothetical protein AAVH_10724 [Aphelenchus avenae]
MKGLLPLCVLLHFIVARSAARLRQPMEVEQELKSLECITACFRKAMDLSRLADKSIDTCRVLNHCGDCMFRSCSPTNSTRYFLRRTQRHWKEACENYANSINWIDQPVQLQPLWRCGPRTMTPQCDGNVPACRQFEYCWTKLSEAVRKDCVFHDAETTMALIHDAAMVEAMKDHLKKSRPWEE